MDRPLLRLAQAAGLSCTGDHEWPEHVDEDIAEFVASADARAIFVVEQADGLVIGPPPKLAGDVRVLAIAKPAGMLSVTDWDREVIAVAMPVNVALFRYIHSLTSQIVLPLFDAHGASESTANARHKLVDAERALASLLQHQHVAFVDLMGGWGNRAKRALAANDLNELQAIANAWKRSLTQLASSDRDVRQGSASDEAGFWAALEAALRSAESQLKSSEVVAVVVALERAKRFHATHNFVGDTGLPEAVTRVAGYQLLFKDLALGELLASQTFPQLASALDSVFTQFSRRLRMSGYPIQRSVLFVEAVGRDFAKVLARIADQTLDDLGENGGVFADFARAVAELSEAWDGHVRDFASLARDLMRRRAERFVVVRVNPSHTGIATRVRALEMLWAKHDELHPLVGVELDAAFDAIINTKGLLQLEDTEWRHLETTYARAAHETERAVADALRVKLEGAGTDAERFEIFAQHRAVLSRPEVRTVVHQFQTALVTRIRNDLSDLQKRTLLIPPQTQIVQRIISMRALGLRMNELLTRTAAVLGADWRTHADGAAIASDCAELQSRINATDAVDEYVAGIDLNYNPKGPVFKSTGGMLSVSAAASHTHTDLRALRALGFRFDPAIVQFGEAQGEIEQWRGRLLDAVAELTSLRGQISLYPRTQSVPTIQSLLQQTFLLVRAGLKEVHWENASLVPFLTTFEQTLLNLSSRISQLASADTEISKVLQDASKTPQELLASVQEMASSVAVPEYITRVSLDLNGVINARCADQLATWQPPKASHRLEVRDQVITVVPELTSTLESWLRDINAIVIPVKQPDEQLLVAFSAATSKVDAELRRATSRLEAWLAFQPFWDLRVDKVVTELGTDLTRWLTAINDLRSMRNKLHVNQAPHSSIELDSREVLTLVDSKCDMWQNELMTRFTELVGALSSELAMQSRKIRGELEAARFEMSSLLPSLLIISQAEALIATSDDRIQQLHQADQLLSRSRFVFPHNWVYADLVKGELTALSVLLNARKNDKDAAKPRLIEALKSRWESLTTQVQHLFTSWLANKPLQATVEAEAALQVTSRFRLEFTKVGTDLKNVQKARSTLEQKEPADAEVSSTITGEIDDVQSEIEWLETAWLCLHDCWNSLNEIGRRKWFNVVVIDLKKELQDLRDNAKELPQRTRQLRAYEKLLNDVDVRLEACNQIALLRESKAIQVHHLSRLLGTHVDGDPSLDDVWLNLPDGSSVSTVVEEAEGELQLTKYMDEVETKWLESKLIGRDMALRNLDAIIQLAADHLAAFAAMRSSPYFSAVSGVVQSWEHRLSSTRRVLDQFVDVQRQFIYLRGVLSARSVQAVLPNETRRFRIVSDEFTEMYSAAVDRPALDFSSEARIAANLGRLLGQLTTLHRSLASFLESQRKRFARFFFVGDDVLLEIVGAKIDDWGWKHLPSIFPGVAKLGMSGHHVTSVVSPEGEILDVKLPETFDDNVEFLICLEKALKKALHSRIVDAVHTLTESWGKPAKFLEWLDSVPCQAALVSLRIQWTQFLKSEALHEAEYDSLLQELAMNDHDNSLLASRRREAVIAELSHQVSHLHPEFPDLEIQTELQGNSVVIRRGLNFWQYGYEYAGVPEVLVRTPLTNDFFFAATAAISQGLGSSVIGPAGTGKTESVKALGSVFGRRVVVFNCDESFDFGTVARVIQGCASTHGWVCFDEFNRLNRKVLSSTAQLISDSVSKHTPVFVTMNPGYAGRTLLPPNMRPQFREFVMAAADSLEIAHVLLYAQGLVDKSIGDAAVSFLSRMNDYASKQKHYDWGLRTLKGVLRLCRLLQGSVRLACEIAIRPRLLIDDIKTFDNQIEKIFGKTGNVAVLSDDVDLSCSSCSATLKPIITSLGRFLKLFTGITLLGPPSCGKTTVWRELANRINAQVVVLDPSAMSKRSVFGWLDTTTREWTDGLITRLLRQVANNLRGEQSHPWLIVFDGEVEPDWAETLNSVLDDNRRLTLPTGEILPLPKNVHLIFEATNLDAATPATVSRCAVICLPMQPLQTERDEVLSAPLIEMAERIDHGMEFSVSRAIATFEALDLENKYLSLAWALAGDSSQEGRELISETLRESASDALPSGALTDYYVSALTGQWHLWSESVAPTELGPDAVTRPEIVVPTAETASHEALLQAALRSRKALLLVGPPGSGKTMTLFNALRQLPQVAIIALNFSTTSTPDLVVKALELHCEYSTSPDGVKVLAPGGIRWAALFIDEINLPAPNSNGVVATTQFLRQIVEQNGFYDQSGEFIRLERVQLVGACNPPPSRRELPQRFLRHLAVIQVGYPSIASLHIIYASFLGSFGAQSLTGPMLSVYEEVNSSLPLEIWTPRELTRWTRGIYTAWNASSESQHSLSLLHQLWYLEGCRILADRLSVTDQNIVIEILKKHSPEPIALSGVWTYIMTQRPQFVSLKGLRDFLGSRLTVFVEEAASEGDSALVIHDAFVEHALRVDRFLRQPQGHGLLVGSHCTGKATMVRFVCWLSGIEVMRLRTHARYNDAEFTRDLRRMLLAALRRPLCFIVSEDALVEPAFVERMNSLLANGEIPGLFASHELAAELEEACRRCGFTGGDITSWFRQRIVANLHVVFTATKLEGMSPALLNRCYVDLVSEWDSVAKRQIAQYWTATTDLGPSFVNSMAMVPCAGHQFVEFCDQVARTYKAQMRELEDTQRHFLGGGDKLKEAVLEIAQLKRQLASKRSQLDAENSRSAKVLSVMLQNQSEAERKRVAAVEIQAAVQVQNAQIEKRRSQANKDLAATQPMIKKAAQGVQNIHKAQLNELRGFTNPPEPVKITLEAVCLVLGLFTDGTWRQVLTAVRGDEFILGILRFDSSKLGSEVVRRIERDYMSLPSFTFERVNRASKACGPLLQWVVAQVAYSKAVASVQPLLLEVEKLNVQAAESTAQLRAIESMLEDLEVAIENLKSDYSAAISQCESIKSEIATVGSQLDRSEALLQSLQGEQGRWAASASEFDHRKSVTAGNGFIEAAFIALGGGRDPEARKLLLQEIKAILDTHEISFDVLKELSSTEIASRSCAVALIVDPANLWSYPENAKITSFLLDPDALLKELDVALRFGQHIVVEHAERYDSLMAPLLNREYVRRGVRHLVNLGGEDIDVAPGFRLTLHARDRRAIVQKQPLLLSRVTFVDFTVSESTFQELVSDALLSARLPELAKRRTELLALDTTTRSRLRSLEKQLLNALADSGSGGLLENAGLLNSLETLKREVAELDRVRASTEATLGQLEEAYSRNAPAACTAARVYTVVRSIFSWDPFYLVSVDLMCAIAQSCAPHENFEQEFTREVYFRVARVVRISHREKLRTSLSEALGSIIKDSSLIELEQYISEAPNTVPVVIGIATAKTIDPGQQIASRAPSSTGLVAMGSNQAASRADRLLGQAMELGEWLVIQNIELADEDWLRSLARRLQGAQPAATFRLVLSGMQEEIIDMPEVLATGRPFSVESVQGVASELATILTADSDARDGQICWIHACFSKAFPRCNFAQPDLAAARWFAKQIGDWGALRAALLPAVYGAKTGSVAEKSLMMHFMKEFLVSRSGGIPDFESKNWVSMLPQDVQWIPKELSGQN